MTPGGSLAIIGARLRTNTNRHHDASALLMRDGIISAIGTDAEIVQLAHDENVQIRDVAGQVVTPGLFDSHTHPHWAVGVTRGVDLGGLNTLEALREVIQSEHSRLPEGEWLLGWNMEYEPFEETGMRADFLDDVAPGRAIAIICYDLHTALGSKTALHTAGIRGSRTFADTSEIVVDDNGTPTGELREPSAYNLLFDAAPELAHDDERDRLRDMFRQLAKVGLTGGAIMDGKPRTIELLAELEERNELDHRLTVHTWHAVSDDNDAVDRRIADKDRRGRLWQGGAIKLFSDGVIDTGTAWLHTQDTCGDGHLAFWPDWARFEEVVRAYHDAGMLIATHAVGDQAVNNVLQVYATLPKNEERPFHSIEHLEILSDADLDLLKGSGVTASMQPLHMQWRKTDFSDNWAVRLGEERASTGFRVRSVLDSDSRLTLGSDWPVAEYDPRIGMAWARGRRTPGMADGNVFEPEQRLTGEEALLAYTLWPAQARGHEDRGVLAVGAVADLTVWEHDPVLVSPDDLVQTGIQLTVVDGRVVYAA